MTGANNYDASGIRVLEGLEAVRKRPGMYIGSTGKSGLHHLVYEIVDNSVDEALAGYCKNIEVIIDKDDVITVTDDGRGIPTGIHPKYNKSAVEIALTKLHAGGKFDNVNYKVSGGLHGVGVSVVNALSEWLKVRVYQNGEIFEQTYHRGKPDEPLKVVGKTKRHGTDVMFKADGEIFSELEYSYETLRQRLRELAFLNKGLSISMRDLRGDEKREDVFRYEGGIISYIGFLNSGKDRLHENIFYFEKEMDTCEIEAAVQYTDAYAESLFSFANNINTTEGGMHVNGMKTALTRCINAYARKYNFLKDNEDNLSGEDIREGMTAIVSVKLKNPEFEGQTKTKLGNPKCAARSTLCSAKTSRPFWRSIRRTPRSSSKRRCSRRAPARPQRRPRNSYGAKARLKAPSCPASFRTVRIKIRPTARYTSSRATRPAAAPNRGATRASRLCFRCAARSSTSKKRASTAS
jgi:DNA gyrase subunit B